MTNWERLILFHALKKYTFMLKDHYIGAYGRIVIEMEILLEIDQRLLNI